MHEIENGTHFVFKYCSLFTGKYVTLSPTVMYLVNTALLDLQVSQQI